MGKDTIPAYEQKDVTANKQFDYYMYSNRMARKEKESFPAMKPLVSSQKEENQKLIYIRIPEGIIII